MFAWLGRSMSEDTAGGTGATSKSIGGGHLIEGLASTNGLSQQQINSLSLKPTKPQIDMSHEVYARRNCADNPKRTQVTSSQKTL